MFSKGLGGIEQAQVDYCEALKMEGHKVTAIIAPLAKIKPALLLLGINVIEIKNFSAWDFFAKAYIKKIMLQLSPDALILHGNRAVSLTKWIGGDGVRNNPSHPLSRICLIGVTHNYSIKHLIGLDAILATTNDLKATVIVAGQDKNKIYKLPNMVRVNNNNYSLIPSHRTPIIIGTMGRFVKKKGFDVFIRAMACLKEQGINFKAVIGGGGEEEASLRDLAAELSLQGEIEFLGWVNNKDKFFANIDIFCLPSLHEPFGIILLEAFSYKKPIVVSDSEGPSEIVSNNIDALLVSKGDSKAMADAVIRLANNADFAAGLARNGFEKAMQYNISNFAVELSAAVTAIQNSHLSMGWKMSQGEKS
jgi:glycosyltransferase involved in cell wall biosynthesis